MGIHCTEDAGQGVIRDGLRVMRGTHRACTYIGGEHSRRDGYFDNRPAFWQAWTTSNTAASVTIITIKQILIFLPISLADYPPAISW